MLNIKKNNSNWFWVEDIYRIPLQTLLEWDNNKDKYYIEDAEGNLVENKNHKFDIEKNIADNILKFMLKKKAFLNECKEVKEVSSIHRYFSDILINVELLWNKDLTGFDYNELIEMFKVLATKNIFTSTSKYYTYMYLTFLYTKWCYEKGYRLDYINTEDLTKKLPLEDLINKIILTTNVMTKNEMLEFAELTNKDNIKIWIYGILEGLSTKEIANLKRSDFESIENHPLDTGIRIVKVSDELYKLMREYAKTDEVEATIISTERYSETFIIKLGETDYLIRPRQTTRMKNKPVDSQVITKAVQQELTNMAITGIVAASFRQNAIMNDYIDGMSLEEINKKYNVKYHHETIIKREAIKFTLLEEKRKQEGTYKPRSIKQNKTRNRKTVKNKSRA